MLAVKRFTSVATALLCCLLLLTGCAGGQQISRRKIVRALALQGDERGYTAVLCILQPEENQYLTLRGEDLGDLQRQLSQREVFLDSADQVFVSDELVYRGNLPLLRQFFIEQLRIRPSAKIYAYTGEYSEEWMGLTREENGQFGFAEIRDLADERVTLPIVEAGPLGAGAVRALRAEEERSYPLGAQEYLGYLLLNRRLDGYKSEWGLIASAAPYIQPGEGRGEGVVTVSVRTSPQVTEKELTEAIESYQKLCADRLCNPIDLLEDRVFCVSLQQKNGDSFQEIL